jgi:predicted NACHT family NTPase
MLKIAALLACCALTLPAHAADTLRDGDQHELPTHKSMLQWHDTLDVIEDAQRGVVCYVARQNDSHALQMQCLKVKP